MRKNKCVGHAAFDGDAMLGLRERANTSAPTTKLAQWGASVPGCAVLTR